MQVHNNITLPEMHGADILQIQVADSNLEYQSHCLLNEAMALV